ncbi:TonB-dependent receptor [Pedobacter sp. AK013]|uniref:TonB-dependent receptor n=1 Tax=Pedobacter sp. AK013 TaxID=2723071 RepID=UPI0017FC23CE|nr:TonB-dependent receptor [Pedobacter sp. AK013]MBB6239510.1 TonB-dependent receptor [Pedobacter sp. AK013]
MELLNSFKRAALTVFALTISILSYAQTGKISGTVTDKKTGETLIGVTVKIKGTTKGVSTDVDGKYTLQAMANGKYTLEFSYVGYQTKEVSDIDVKSPAVTSLNVVLNEAGGQNLQEVVVKASYKQESINTLYAQQKNSALISDGISSDQIKKSPDKNTSDVLKRISGATIQDNKFVVVRGLSDRYNTATLDNSTLPSTEPNRKAFSFDIVPSNLVDKITISKTATPDLPADFAGGAVQITTKDIPDQNFLSFGIGYGYNSQSTFKDFSATNKNTLSYLGFEDGAKQLAENFPSAAEVASGLTKSKNLAALKSFPTDNAIKNTNALPTQNYQLNLGRVKHFENNDKFGALFSVTYRNAQNINQNVERNFYVYNYNDNQYKFSTNLGALANFAYSYGKNKISFKNIYNKNYDDNYTTRAGIKDGNSLNQFYAYDVMQKSLFKTTLEGDHQIGEGNNKLKWTASYSNVGNNQPNQLKINYTKPLAAQNDPSVLYQANITSLGKDNTRLFADLNENIYSGDVNYSTPFKLFNASTTFKIGLGSQYRDRNYTARFLGAQLNINDIDEQQRIRALPITEIFSQSLFDAGVYELKEIGSDLDNYKANSFTNYGYVMLDEKITEKFRAVYGVRIENYKVQLLNDIKTYVDDTKLDFLPSVNLTYSLNAKSNLRASYYRTLARPEFRELSLSSYYDYELLANQQGNPNLKRTSIDNADLRYEIYPNAGEILSVSAFYKKFTNAIESYRYDVLSTPDISYFNTKKAYSYGLEFEARKTLGFISDNEFLKNTTAYFNLSLVKSKVTNPDDQNYIDKVRPMVGQSPYVFNAGLQHSALDNKLNFSLLYNKIGRRIMQASGIVFPSTWENPRDVLDFQASYKVIKSKGEIKLNVSDILNQRSIIYFDYNGDKKYNGSLGNGGDETAMSYKPGTNISLSFNYTF